MMNLNNRLFPLDLHESLHELINIFLKGGNYLFEYRTGGGKTTLAMMLAVLLSSKYGKRVLFFTRTHLHMNEIYLRINKLAEKTKLQLIPVLGKETLCPYSQIYSDPYEACFNLRTTRRCILYNNLWDSRNLYSILKRDFKDIDDLVSSILIKGFCPYYYLYGAASNANIILASYYHLFHPPRYLILNPFQYAIIIDEFHNLPFYYPNLRVFKIDCKELLDAISFIEKIHEKTVFVDYIINELLDCNASEFVDNYKINLIARILRNIAFTIKNYYMYKDENLAELYPQLVKLPEFITNRIQSIEVKDGTIYIHYRYNFNFLRRLFKSSYLNLFISATLSPPKLFKRFIRRAFGLSDVFFIDHVSSNQYESMQVQLYMIRGYTSLYRRRSKALYESIAHAIIVLTRKYGDIIVFTVSNDFADKLHNELTNLQNYNNLIVIRTYSELEILNKYHHFIKILLFTHRSSFSEGINILRDINIRNVAIVGLPIPPPSSEIAKYVYLSYGYKGQKNIIRYGYIHPAIISIVQSIGRLLAYKEPKVNVFVFEDRLRKYIFSEMVPNWFKSAINIKEMTLNEK